MRAERPVTVSQETLRFPIVSINRLLKEAVTALRTMEAYNGVKRADSRVQDMLQGMLNKRLDEKMNFLSFEDYSSRKLKKQHRQNDMLER